MRYQVPQFIEVEDKIFGPLTVKQFVFLAGGAGMCFIIYYLTGSFSVALPFMVVIGCFSAGLAFYKVNSRPLLEVIEYAVKYLLTNRLYIWQKRDKKINTSSSADLLAREYNNFTVPKISESKLKDLAWSLDINETIYSKDTQKLHTKESLRDSFRM